jgi:DNA helicase TIP49 (TBP-interacting protein)
MNLSFPKAPAVFAGRKKILDQLKTGFLHYNVLIIDGMAGTGKTALSLYFASTIDSSPDFLPFYGKSYGFNVKKDGEQKHCFMKSIVCLKKEEMIILTDISKIMIVTV